MTATKPKQAEPKAEPQTFIKSLPVNFAPGLVDWPASDHSFRFWLIRKQAAEAGYEVLDVEFISAEPSEFSDQLTMLNYQVTYTGGPDGATEQA